MTIGIKQKNVNVVKSVSMDKYQEPYWAPDLIEDEKFDSASSFNQS
jgi:hypothetical protein